MNEFYMDIKKYIKENYSEYKEMSENDEQNYNTKENKKNIIKKNNEMDNEEKYRSLSSEQRITACTEIHDGT